MGACTPQRPGLGAATKAVAGDPGFLDTVLLHPLPSGLQRPLLGPGCQTEVADSPVTVVFLETGEFFKSMFSAKKAVKEAFRIP